MSGPAAITALVLLESAVGLVAIAAWTQSWAVVRRGHFRIAAWSGAILAGLGVAAFRAASPDDTGLSGGLVLAAGAGAGLYVAAQYVRSDGVGAAVGAGTGAVGAAGLAVLGSSIAGWPAPLAALALVAGAALVGAVLNGMLLGHWYLNQPGLQPWALGRLATLGLVATATSLLSGIAGARLLASASTEGAVLGLPGFGDSFAPVFFVVWAGLAILTGVVVWMARRCVALRSIQSATGLFYVAVLTAALAEFVVRFLMVNVAASA